MSVALTPRWLPCTAIRQRRTYHATAGRASRRGRALLRRSELGLEERVDQLEALRGELQEAVARAGGGLQEQVPLLHPHEFHEDAAEPVQDRVHLDEDALQDLLFSVEPHPLAP